ncbi:MAG: CoA pyrophosphatase [Actinomycetota bacterium]|nr:CoA pyrophosphatase [Actinomycetota bacterium]
METTAASSLRDRLAAVLQGREKAALDLEGQVPAAVIIPIFERDGEPWMIFTRRTQHVKHHKGEISFPGGARDPQDETIQATAIRETVEELGIDSAMIDIVGELDDYPTFVTNYLISPFVAMIPEDHSFSHSEREIDEIIELPVREMATAVRTEDWSERGRPFPMYFYESRGYTIWGVTGHILQRFFSIAGEALGIGPVEVDDMDGRIAEMQRRMRERR